MKKITLSLIVLMAAFGLMAQSNPLQDAKNSYDPYIAQKSGFESLFVNPAGMAGQTNIFNLDLQAGTQGKKSTYQTIQLMMNNSGALTPSGTSTMTPQDAQDVVTLLSDNLDQTSINLLTNGTVLQNMTASQIQDYFNSGNTLSQADVDTVATNVQNNQDAILQQALSNLKVTIDFSTKAGTLIKGVGIGLYGNVYSVLNAADMGFGTLLTEAGIKAGYGFNLGDRFALGVSGKFAGIGDLTYDGPVALQNISAIMSKTMYSGYSWGIDAGMTFNILPSLTVGAVMTDIIGSSDYTKITTLQDILNGTSPTSTMSFKYTFDTDIDGGITWSPKIGNGKIINASFSADYYNLISLFRKDTQPQNFQDVLDHMRVGAQVELLSFIEANAQYYQQYFTVGAGVDLLFLEVMGEFQFNQTFDDIGAGALVKLHF